MLPTSVRLTEIEVTPVKRVAERSTMIPAFLDQELFLQLSKPSEPALARFGLSVPYGKTEITPNESYNMDVDLFDSDVINYLSNLDGKIESAVNADPAAFFHHVKPSQYVPMIRDRDGVRYARVKVPANGEDVVVTRMLSDGTLGPATIQDIRSNTHLTVMVRFNGIYLTDKSFACSLKLVRVLIHPKVRAAAPELMM